MPEIQVKDKLTTVEEVKAAYDALDDSKVAVTDIVNNLTSTATNKPLAAAQGKALNDNITSLSGQIGNYTPMNKGGDITASSLSEAVNKMIKAYGTQPIGQPFTFAFIYNTTFYFGIACYSLSNISFGRFFYTNTEEMYSFRNNNNENDSTLIKWVLNQP